MGVVSVMPLLVFVCLILYLVVFPAKIMRSPIAIHDFLKPMVIKVEVVSLVKRQHCYESFTLRPLNQSYYFQASWFSCDLVDFHVGDILEADMKLKPLHAMNNPGGFDSMQWAKQNNVVAQATIKSAKKISDAEGVGVKMERLREHLDQITCMHLQDSVAISIIESLTLGITQNLSWETLRVFNLSGTRHLLSISGSHIAMVAMMSYFVFFGLMRVVIIFFPKINAHTWAIGLSVFLVGFYVSISGGQLPTLRAFWMALIALAAIFFHRQSILINRIIVAAIVVIVMDNEAIYSPSLYLSFLAVFLIAYHQLWSSRISSKWRNYLGLNLLLLFGLLPVSLYFFSQFSFIAILANLVAIPWVSFILLPGAIALQWCSDFGWQCHFLWVFLEWMTQGFFWTLTFFSEITAKMPGMFLTGHINVTVTVILSLMVLIAFLPKGAPGKWLCVLAFIPLFLARTEPEEGHAQLVFLNVGQGLSIVVKTSHHLLVYDTGPSFFSGGDVAQSVIIPYFYYKGWKKIDTLIVSHGDSDHSGGASTLRKNFPIKQILSSDLKKVPGATLCERGQHWQWDGVNFQILYPDDAHQHQGNNSSCVLKITSGKTSALLVGDIEKPTERYLTHDFPEDLSATLISVPHHGSKTSSSEIFLSTVHPKIAIFSYGFLNRFHFPNSVVMKRYAEQNIDSLVTESGPVFVEISSAGVTIEK